MSGYELEEKVRDTRKFEPVEAASMTFDELAPAVPQNQDRIDLALYRTLVPRVMPAERSLFEAADAIANYLGMPIQIIVNNEPHDLVYGSLDGKPKSHQITLMPGKATIAFASDPCELADEKRAYVHGARPLLEQILQNAMSFKQLRDQTTIDPLTGLLNNAGFVPIMDLRVAAYARETKKYVLGEGPEPVGFSYVVLDLDHFKRINDTYGHSAGDEALKTLAKYLLAAAKRQTDTVVRFHGEEFGMVMECSKAEALKIVEKLRSDIARQTRAAQFGEFPLYPPSGKRRGYGKSATASFGLAHTNEFTVLENLSTNVFDLADKRMYAAKHRGRNQVNSTLVPHSLGSIVSERYSE